MIEVIERRKKIRKGYKEILRGYVEGKQYFNEEKELIGYLDKNVYKVPSGYPILTLTEVGELLNEENEWTGYYENETFDWSDMYFNSSSAKYCIRKYSKTSGEIYGYNENLIGYLKGDISALTDLDYFGILVSFFEVGA